MKRYRSLFKLVTLVTAFVAITVFSPVKADILIENLNPTEYVQTQSVTFKFYPCALGENCDVDLTQAALNQCSLSTFPPAMNLVGEQCTGNVCKKWKAFTTDFQQIGIWVQPGITRESDCPEWVLSQNKEGINGQIVQVADQRDPLVPTSFVIHPNTVEERFDIDVLRVTITYEFALSADDTDIDVVQSPLGDVSHRDTGKASIQFSVAINDTAHREGTRELVAFDWVEENGNIQTLVFPPNPNNYRIVRTKTFDIPMRQNGTFELNIYEKLEADTGILPTPEEAGQQGIAFSFWSIELEMINQ